MRICRLRTALSLILPFLVSGCSVTLEEDFLFWVPKDVDFVENNEEAGTGLFMGRALLEPMDRDLTARGYWTTKVEFRLKSEDFIPTEIERDRIAFDGGELEILRVDRKNSVSTAPVFLHCAGIGQSIYNNGVQHALKLLPYGDIIQFDMPAHGLSSGTASVADLDAAVDRMATYAVEQAADRPLIFYGHSLGGYICAGMAARASRADALVIEASGKDAESVANAWVPRLARPFFRIRTPGVVDSYNMPELLAGFDKPILAIGGENDDVVPERLVRDMASALKASGHDIVYAEMKDVDHSTIPFASSYAPTVEAFFSQLKLEP
ncbi:MAG: alpha/beta fold hydrolase [Pseudomonadota bacterium]